MGSNDSDKYLNKYRISSNRLRGWNYAQSGHYFITIVTYGRKHLFGKIVDGQMILNPIGEIVNAEFLKSFELRKELYLGGYVIMPNHIHAILILDKEESVKEDAKTSAYGIAQREPKSISSFVAGFKSSSINRIDDWIDAVNAQNRNGGNVGGGNVDGGNVGGGNVGDGNVDGGNVGDGNVGDGNVGDGNVETHGRASLPRLHGIKKFNKNNPLWQNNYHDHIIRNETEYRRISEYIVNNPLKWDKDTLSNGEHCEPEG